MMMPELVDLPPGEFMMGGDGDDKFVTDVERPQHRVVISAGTSLSRYPVTQHDFSGNGVKLPVVKVSWSEAKEFALHVGKRLGGVGRLPTEAEWEWAARCGREKVAVASVTNANFLYDEDGKKVGKGSLTKVGSYPLNDFGYGDLFGNVLEWTEDSWHPDYENAPQDGDAWTGGSPYKVVRGGAWDLLPRLLRPTWRDGVLADARRDNLGFRVAVDFRSGLSANYSKPMLKGGSNMGKH